ncbi:IDEAL domain-containing protein [Cytobacillus praedii]|uniref:IDEAL domain-containing protein n=1 Tax=Cytobacillus praedii TaxID=1742358 RepID=A0A4R1B1X7_9BACI|nr:IDEAL domain-containing protein [Cytobacillus praedii]MED3551489.1 IDEAL domain-containing protein [Cytobacillus praedii]TCJ04886.1 IDEAL domain-containing protein [Cytobacillus praedii]
MNEKSYTELMKKSAMKKKQLKESFVLDLYIDMLLSEILLKKEKAKLMEKIDEAIDTENKRAFNSLSKQYLELTKRFGT